MRCCGHLISSGKGRHSGMLTGTGCGGYGSRKPDSDALQLNCMYNTVVAIRISGYVFDSHPQSCTVNVDAYSMTTRLTGFHRTHYRIPYPFGTHTLLEHIPFWNGSTPPLNSRAPTSTPRIVSPLHQPFLAKITLIKLIKVDYSISNLIE